MAQSKQYPILVDSHGIDKISEYVRNTLIKKLEELLQDKDMNKDKITKFLSEIDSFYKTLCMVIKNLNGDIREHVKSKEKECESEINSSYEALQKALMKYLEGIDNMIEEEDKQNEIENDDEKANDD